MTLPGTERVINGTNASEVLQGTIYDDLIRGRGGSDSIDGIDGDDYLEGNLGNDTLIGSSGNDWLIGGAGDDVYNGGAGADQFRFYGNNITGAGTANPGHDVDTIEDLDFAAGDLIQLSSFAAATFAGTDINGQLDILRGGTEANIRSWAGLVDLVASSAAITAARAPGTDTLLMTINNANGASQTIAILNGWPTYVALTNQAPTATIDTAAVDEDSVASGSLLLNDVDPDGDTLSVNAVTADGGTSQAVPPGGSKAVQGLYGILTVGSDGSYSYAATGDAAQALASGQVVKETFSYTVTDAGGLTSTAPLEVTVTGTNDAPVAQALAGTAAENGPAITFAANFTDVDAADSHTVSLDTTGVKGKVVLNADGSFTYDADGKFETLNAGQTATETFTYKVDDGQGGTSTETVTVTIVGQNDDPKAIADFNGVVKNGKLSVSAANGVLANDSDVEGNSLTVLSFNGATPGQTVVGKYGSLTMNADGSYTYQASTKPGALPSKTVAQDHFTYTVSDGNGGSHTERLTITVHDKGQTYTRGTDGANSLTGGKGQDVLDGGNGNDVLNGGNGTDALLGGRGDDILTGGAGADTFVFNADFGKDVITDFTRGLDRLQFDRDVFADYADMLDSAIQSGADVLIDAGGGNMITLKNVQMTALQAGDFVFV